MQEREGDQKYEWVSPEVVHASMDPRSNAGAYAGIVLTAAERARAIAAELKGAERRGALKVAEDIERWAEQVKQQNS